MSFSGNAVHYSYDIVEGRCFGHADIVRQLNADVNAVCEMRIQHSYPFEDLLGTETVVEVETTTPFLAAIGSGNLKLVEEMLLRGADLNVIAGSGETMLTPLRSAARRGQPDVLKFLLSRVCLEEKDPGALNEAAQNGNLACVRILVENGWDVNAVELGGLQDGASFLYLHLDAVDRNIQHSFLLIIVSMAWTHTIKAL